MVRKSISTSSSKSLRAFDKSIPADFCGGLRDLAQDLNVCSRQGLSERFDSTIGAGTVLMPFGGRDQRTPVQAMVQKISLERGHTDDCSLMSWGYNPYISEKDPYRGAYLAVVESVSKLIATGAAFEDVYLTFQEYFERLRREPARWGKPLAALLGAFAAQMALGIGAVGGKDSMSGSFEQMDVPPTLVSFAVVDGEGHKRRGNVHLLKRAAHGVLAAHSTDAERHLRGKRTQQRRKGLAPAGGLAPQPLEILLERQVNVLKRRAGGNELAHALDHGKIGPAVGILLGDIGIISPGHERAVVRVTALKGDFLYHRLHGRALVTVRQRA